MHRVAGHDFLSFCCLFLSLYCLRSFTFFFLCVCVCVYICVYVCVCVSVQPKKIETRTLDAVITRLNAEGKKVSVTSKCADFDREVSKCIFMCVFLWWGVGYFVFNLFMITNTETGQLNCIFM